MELQLFETASGSVAVLIGEKSVINTIRDALDMMGHADYIGARSIIIYEHQLAKEFFNLRSGFAGEILQKFSNYQMKLAIVGDFDRYESNALQAFIFECNRGKGIFFVKDKTEAIEKLDQ